ncbi:MAG: response regulator [Burkholderiaceae bacterium]|nr:response regulator [Burkholderiaceae bacterium]
MSDTARPDDPAASHSTAEVARRLGVSIPTVQRWVDQGHLKAWKTVGGHRRIDAHSVERFVRSRDRRAGDPVPTVLVVDDNPDDRDLLAALVELALPGAEISVADGGFEGLLHMGRRMPDILVTDVVMPDMDGLQMLRHVATQTSTRPRLVVAVSSRTPAQFAEQGALPGGVKFVAKPIDPDAFVGMLRAAGARPAPA